jgi:hypothetical protein
MTERQLLQCFVTAVDPGDEPLVAEVAPGQRVGAGTTADALPVGCQLCLVRSKRKRGPRDPLNKSRCPECPICHTLGEEIQFQSFQIQSDDRLERKLIFYISFGIGDVGDPECLLDHVE